MRLPNEDPNCSRLYLQWLYRGTIPSRSDSPDDAEYESLAGAYVLEERLKDGVFCDVIIDAMVEKYNTKATDGAYYCPGCEDIEYIYKHTRASSPARRLVVCLYALHGDKEWLAGWEKIPKDIVLDFALALLDKESLPNLRQEAASTCEYHQHGSTSRCYRTLQVRGRGATKCGHFCDASFLAYLCQTPIAKGPKLLLECTRELWTMALQYIGRRN